MESREKGSWTNHESVAPFLSQASACAPGQPPHAFFDGSANVPLGQLAAVPQVLFPALKKNPERHDNAADGDGEVHVAIPTPQFSQVRSLEYEVNTGTTVKKTLWSLLVESGKAPAGQLLRHAEEDLKKPFEQVSAVATSEQVPTPRGHAEHVDVFFSKK